MRQTGEEINRAWDRKGECREKLIKEFFSGNHVQGNKLFFDQLKVYWLNDPKGKKLL